MEIQCAVCALLHLQWRKLHSASWHRSLVPRLHLKVCFDVPCRTTFPTKMAPLRNSLSSLSQHDLLMLFLCVCVFKYAKSVFNYVTLHGFFLFCFARTFWPFSQSAELDVLRWTACVCVCVCNRRSMHMFHTACMLMLVHESIMSNRHFKRTAIALLSTRGTKEQTEPAFTQVSTRYSFHSIITVLLISSHCDAAHSWASHGFSVFITQHNPTNYGMNGKFELSRGL